MKDIITIKKRTVDSEDSDFNTGYSHSILIENKSARIYEKNVREFRNDGSLVIKKVQKVAFLYDSDLDLDEGDLAIINNVTFEITKVNLVYAANIKHHWELEIKKIVGE